MVRHPIPILILGGVGLIVGCGEKSGAVKVSGTVTYQGKPVEGANVIFAADGDGRSASGTTDADGRFQLTTLQPGDGAIPGKYSVSVSKVEVENPMSADEAREWFIEHGGPPEGGNIKNALPEVYRGSGLTAEVSKGGENDFTFELK